MGTNATLAHRVEQLAHGLQQVGIGLGEPVALLAENRPEAIVACLAVIKSGAVIAPLDVQFSPNVLEFALKDSGTGFLIDMAAAALRLESRKMGPVITIFQKKPRRPLLMVGFEQAIWGVLMRKVTYISSAEFQQFSVIHQQEKTAVDQAIRKALAQASKQLPSYQHLSDYVLAQGKGACPKPVWVRSGGIC